MKATAAAGHRPSTPDAGQGSSLHDVADDNEGGAAPLTSITGYSRSRPKTALVWAFITLTAGLPGAVFFWRPVWFLKCTHSRAGLDAATRLLLVDANGLEYIERVEALRPTRAGDSIDQPLNGGVYEAVPYVRFFRNRRRTYLYDPAARSFYEASCHERGIPLSTFEHAALGLDDTLLSSTDPARQDRLNLFGPNELSIPVPSFLSIMFAEVLTPFYAFQVFSVTLWYNDDYWFYATCIVIISLLTLIKTTRDIKRDRETLSNKLSPITKPTHHDKLAPNHGPTVNIYTSLSSDAYVEIRVRDLVPGDVLRIPPRLDPVLGYVVPCDAVLIHGSCIVDECMLTGESIPVTKSPINKTDEGRDEHKKQRYRSRDRRNGRSRQPSLSNSPDQCCFDKDFHSKHVLYNGTKILQTRVYGNDCVKAYVTSTGFQTTKGRMVLNFLYPKPNEFRFDQDSFKFVASLFALSLVGLVYSLTLKILQGVPVKQIIIRSLDLVAIVVPPALPAAMTVGMMFAQKRLKKYSVLCISPDHVNACGVIDVMCFDKTGTLTEEGLDIWGALPTFWDDRGKSDRNKADGVRNNNGNNVPGGRGDFCLAQDSLLTDASSHQWDSDGSLATDITVLTNSFHQEATAVPKMIRFVPDKIEALDSKYCDHFGPTPIEGGKEDAVVEGQYSTHHFTICTALCHSLTLINDIIVGDPLEIKMFQFSGWSMTDPNICPATAPAVAANFLGEPGGNEVGENNEQANNNPDFTTGVDYKCDMLLSGIFNPPSSASLEPNPEPSDGEENSVDATSSTPTLKRQLNRDAFQYGVLHQYPFAPALQRMSVLVRRLMGPYFELYSKGAPEVIQKLCIPASLPPDYCNILNSLADQGFRVIACAYRTLPEFKLTGIKKVRRTEIEKNLTFLGFLVFQNKLKAKSGETLDIIRAANIRSVMVTGDNILTALSVAKESRLIPENVDEACLVDATPDPFDQTILKFNFTMKKLTTPSFSHTDATSTKDNRKLASKSVALKVNGSQGRNFVTGGQSKFKNPVCRFLVRLYHELTCNKFEAKRETTPPLKTTMFGASIFSQGADLPNGSTVGQGEPVDVYTLYDEQGEPCTVTPNTVFAMTGPTFEAIDNYKRRRTTSHLDGRQSSVGDVSRQSFTNREPYRRPSNADQHLEPVVTVPLVGGDGVKEPSFKPLAKKHANGSISSFPFRDRPSILSTVIDMAGLGDEKDLGDDPISPQHFLDYLLTHQCLVFARMTPEHKTRLIRALQSLDYFVGMCGDGANDCGALKSAHMGISLASPTPSADTEGIVDTPLMAPSGGEASLAAPFTAECGDISCVPHVIREGRASLVTSFGVFKGMACYSLNQFFAVLALYWLTTNFSDTQFAYVDFFTATILTMLMGYTKAYPRLEGHLKPDSSLAGASHIGSVIGHITINIAFLMIVFNWTRIQPWVSVYDPDWDHKNQYYPQVVTAFFVLTSFQYISFPVIFSRGPPFRRPFTTNVPFLVMCLALVAASVYFAIGIPYWAALAKFFKFKYAPTLWPGLFYLVLALANFLVSSFFEMVVLGHWLAPYLRQRDLFLRKTVPRHQLIGKFNSWAQVFSGFGPNKAVGPVGLDNLAFGIENPTFLRSYLTPQGSTGLNLNQAHNFDKVFSSMKTRM